MTETLRNKHKLQCKFTVLASGKVRCAHSVEGGIPATQDPDYWTRDFDRDTARKLWRQLVAKGYKRAMAEKPAPKCKLCGESLDGSTATDPTLCDSCEDAARAIARNEFHDPDLAARDAEASKSF